MPAPSIVHGPAPGSVGFKNLAKWIARAVARGIRRHASKSRGLGGWGAEIACRMGSLGLTQARAMAGDWVVTARAVRTVRAREVFLWYPPNPGAWEGGGHRSGAE